MQIKCFRSPILESNMYVVSENGRSIVIDPFVSEPALRMLRNNRIGLDLIILTHEHYDHISGVNWLKETFPCKVLCSRVCAERICDSRKNHSRYYEALSLMGSDSLRGPMDYSDYECHADETFASYFAFSWEGNVIELFETPGHSKGSSCITVNGEYLFSGDTLLLNTDYNSRLPRDDKTALLQVTKPILSRLSPNMVVYPGHGDSFYLSEYKWNI